jgi:hypothetical protein
VAQVGLEKWEGIYVSSHGKAASARSNDGRGGSRSVINCAFAVRGNLRGGDGSGAPSGRLASIAALGLLACLFFAPVALAAPPAVTADPASAVGVTTAKVKGAVNPNGAETTYRFEYISEVAYQDVRDEKQEIYAFGGDGAFLLHFQGQTTAPIAFNASAATVESALNALSTIGGVGGSVAVTGGPGSPSGTSPYKVTFGGVFAGNNVDELVFEAPFYGYATTTQEGHAIGFGGAFQAGNGTLGAGAGLTSVPGPDPLLLEGLTANTTYRLRLVAENADGTQIATAANFTTAPATAPTAAVAAATSVSYASARISGTVDPNGGNTDPDGRIVPIEWDLQYSAEPSKGWSSAGVGLLTGAEATSTDPIAVPIDPGANAVNLKGGTQYSYRLVTRYAGLLAQSAEPNPEFTTLPVETPDAVSIEPASSVLESSAHLSGKVKRPANADPAFDIDCRFEYVTDAQFLVNEYAQAARRDCQPDVSKDAGEHDVTADLGKFYYGDASLDFNTKYHVRLTVSNAGGTDSVEAPTFTTLSAPGPPAVTIDPVAAISGRSATFSGTINPGGTDMSRSLNWHFECTPECQAPGGKSLGGEIGAEPNSAPTNFPIAVQATAKLKANTSYQVKLVATGVTGVEGFAGPVSFSTPVVVGALTGSAGVTATTASLSGVVDPGGAATNYHFDYGTTAAYGQSTPSVALPASDEKAGVTEALAELAPGTTYHYRLVATNSAGTANGADKTFTTAAGAAGSCPNATVREQQKSTFLPECRAYEIVNNPSDEIGDVNRVPYISESGEAVSFTTATAGAEALSSAVYSVGSARRSATGWVVSDANVFPARPTGALALQTLLLFSQDFKRVLWATTISGDPADETGARFDMYRIDVGTGKGTWLSPFPMSEVQFMGATPDLDRVVFSDRGNKIWIASNGSDAEEVSIKPGGGGSVEQPYPAGQEATRGAPALMTISEVSLPHGGTHPVSDDARRVFFYDAEANSPRNLYVRDTVAKETILVSASQRTGEVGTAHAAEFIAATHDGEFVYFRSDEQLTDGATPGGGIYRFNVVTKVLTLITPPTGGAGLGLASISGINSIGAALSDDGSHLYFNSPRALVPGAEGGDSNIYVTSGGTTRLVASSPTPIRLQRVSVDGRYALMASTGSIDGAPNNGHEAIYEYDDATANVACVSCRPDGAPSFGDASLDAVALGLPRGFVSARAITTDGRVFFTSSDQLVAADLTPALDVYMYDKGVVSLITTGRSEKDSYYGDSTDDGKNVFVMTRSALVPQDADSEELDVYDVRVGGGYLLPPPPATPCAGEACRGAASRPAAQRAPVSSSFIGAGNKQSGRNQAKKHHKKKHHKRKHHKKRNKGAHKRAANAMGRAGR